MSDSKKWREELESVDPLDALRRIGGGARQVAPVRKMDSATEATIPIDQIYPDPAQPRRAIPALLREDWVSGIPIDEVLQAWETAAGAAMSEAGGSLRWKHIIAENNDPTPLDESLTGKSPDLPPVVASWMALVKLAAGIKMAGLQQRIAVLKTGPDAYRLLFGERRLLAFHLLNWMSYEGFDEIPAFEVDQDDGFKLALIQAEENGNREDLNAIERARQLALLLMALNPGQWQPFEGTGQPDWAWYQQAHGLRVPYGKAEVIYGACGFKNKDNFYIYRKLLAIPEDVALLADEHGWPEGKLRKMMRDAENFRQLSKIARQEAGLEPKPKASPSPKPSMLDMTDQVHKVIKPMVELPDAEIRKMPKQQRESLKATLLKLAERL